MKTLRVVVGLILLGAAAIVCVLAIRVASGGREPAAAMRAADAKLGALREEARRIGDLAAGAEARALELRGKLDELKKQAGADASSKGRQPGIVRSNFRRKSGMTSGRSTRTSRSDVTT